MSRLKEKGLTGQIAVVAGATRGAGRGIARALGEAGATVYCTGRSVRGNPSPYDRPETIEETAGMIRAAGGKAIAVRVDHTVESAVEAFFGRIDREHHRLDVLVNSIAGEEPMMAQWSSFWKTNLKDGEGRPSASAPLAHHHRQACRASDDPGSPRPDRRGDRERYSLRGRKPAVAERQARAERSRAQHGGRAEAARRGGRRDLARLSPLGNDVGARRRHGSQLA